MRDWELENKASKRARRNTQKLNRYKVKLALEQEILSKRDNKQF